jgi:hypothetical protein
MFDSDMPYLIGTDLHRQKKNPANAQPKTLSHSFCFRGVFFPASLRDDGECRLFLQQSQIFFDQHRMPLIDWQKFSGIFPKASPRKSYPSGTKLKANKSM